MKPTDPLTRRSILGVAASATVTRWVYAAGPRGGMVRVTTQDDVAWQPSFFTAEQARAIGTLCEAILPRTGTPGALDARVHEFIDLELSLEEDEDERAWFLGGLSWLDERCRWRHGHGLAEISVEQATALLEPISDLHDDLPKELARGGSFFRDLKRRTIFAYYTSEVGRTQELGLPDAVTMETWRGCRHGGGDHL